jgi:hypothetical protein
MTSAIESRRRSRNAPRLALVGVLAAAAAGCASFVEVPVETPLQSKLDVSSFRRVLIAGFLSDPGESDVDLSPETVRLLQNQLRSHSKLQILEPDHPPLHDALDRVKARFGEGERLSKTEKDQYRLEAEKVLQDGDFWRRIGEEFQTPLIVTGKIGFASQNRSGFQAEERVVRDARNRPVVQRGNRYIERKGFSLNADFYFVDGRSGQTLHKEKFTEEVLYGEDQKVSPLSSYFELMDRLLPNFLGVISPQKIRGTRILLQ